MFLQHLRQTATYWAPAIGDITDVFGSSVFSAPQTVSCRWEQRSELFRDKLGQEVHSNAVVFLGAMIALDGYLLLGTSTASSPLGLSGAYEIRMIKNLPDLRNLRNLWVAYL